MGTEDTARRIERVLGEDFAPLELVVADESHRHRGHAGREEGKGHFRVRLVSERFRGEPRLARHRLVYAALSDELRERIHALALELYSPEERDSSA